MKDQITVRIKLGDEQAFELLFQRYYIRLCGFVNKFLNDADEAQEIVQDVFARIWEGREDLDPNKSIKAYLFMIAQNQSINKLRRLEVESKYAEIHRMVYVEYSEFSSHESLFARELDGQIYNAINKLPAKCKQVFELSRLKGLKYNEIAETLNISVKTVEAQISKALQSIRLELKDYLS